MANEEHVARLKEGVEAWNRWRQMNPGIKPALDHIDLTDAYLSTINLSEARLRSANLSQTNFSEADLSRADLGFANLDDTILTGANLNSARIGFTFFGDLDLSTVKGLENVIHLAPSTIGIDTLFRSAGKIPEVFLRGCGVPESLIEYLPSLVASRAVDFYSCFISYNHADKSFARRLHDQLQARGIRCWLDEKQMLPGDDIYEQIDRGIKLWDKVLLCCSESSLRSAWVDNEIDSAFEKERRLMGERGEKTNCLIPLDLDGYLFSGDWKSGKERWVKSRLTANFQGWESDNAVFEREFERVVKALRGDDGGREQPPVSKL